jgi:CDP-glucose 4,6-dehydratase
MDEWKRSLENVEMNPSFWSGKKVFITGHTGFKGGWLCHLLSNLGSKVTGYSLLPNTNPNLFECSNVENIIYKSIIGDIRDYKNLEKSITDSKATHIFHLAAQPLVRESYLSPVDTYSTNVMGTVHILESFIKSPFTKVLINITTDKVYENKEWEWGYRENDSLGGRDPYSNSKSCAELVTFAYRKSFIMNNDKSISTVRAGNVIGGGDWSKDRLIPDILKCINEKQDLIIRNPNSIRPWQHVLEPLMGYLLLSEKMTLDPPTYSGEWNFGPEDNDSKSVEWIVDSFSKNLKIPKFWKIDTSIQPHESNYLKLDCSKAKNKLGWFPRWNLEVAIQKILEWNLHFNKGSDMKKIIDSQIKSYYNNN